MRPGDQDLGAFLEEEVLPALFDRLDSAFPEFGWRRDRDGWVATNRDHTKNVTGARPDRVVCHVPFGFKVYGGDFTTWVSYVNGGTPPHGRYFVEAVRKLAGLAGVQFPERERTPEEIERAEKRERRETLLRAFLAHVHENLTADTGKDARDYLAGRGLTGPAVEDLGLFTTREAVRSALTSKGFTVDEVNASGVVHDGRWEGRLIIPWRDRWGRLGTFAARDLTGTAEDPEKYLYMTTAEGRAKRKVDLVAFGLDRALRARADHLVLVEGLLDVVNLQARGFLNVAAIGGKGHELTNDRWRAVAALGVSSVVLALDNDASGHEGTAAAVENVINVPDGGNVINVPVYVVDPVLLGEGTKDPDAYVHKNGLDAFLALLDKREAAELYKGRHILGDVTPESPGHLRDWAVFKVAEYAETLHGERASIHVENLLHLAADRTGYTVEALVEVKRKHEERRRREEAERRMDRLINKAKADSAGGADPWAVAADLVKDLSSMKARAVDVPLSFSVDRLERESKNLPAGRSSGWAALDRQEVFFNPGELAVIGGRTGHCKTSALVNLLVNWAKGSSEEDEVFVFYSQEEPEVFIYHRLLVRLTADAGDGWSMKMVRDFKRGGASSRPGFEWPPVSVLDEARETVRKWESRLLVVNRPSWTVEEIEAHVRDFASRQRVGAVLVDYLQRIPAPAGGSYDRRDIEVSTVARRLKALAVDLSVSVVVGAQINREAVPDKYREKVSKAARKGGYKEAVKEIREARPDLYHLREGGAEQEADLVLGLLNYAADYRTDEGETPDHRVPDVTRLEVGTLKSRYSPSGRWAVLAFEGRFNLIRDVETWDEV